MPFDRKVHQNLGIAKTAGEFASSLHAIYLTQTEICRAAQDYPVVFARDANQSIVPIGLVGVEPGQNLLCDDSGRWYNDYYVPAYVRRYPFFLARVQGKTNNLIICVDEKQLDSSGPPLIDDHGRTTSEWSAIEKLVQEFDAHQQQSQNFCERLEAFELFETFDADFHPKPLNKKQVSGHAKLVEPARINGLLRINRQRLNALPDAELGVLIRNNSIASIEAHLNSFNRFDRLLNLYAIKQSKMA